MNRDALWQSSMWGRNTLGSENRPQGAPSRKTKPVWLQGILSSKRKESRKNNPSQKPKPKGLWKGGDYVRGGLRGKGTQRTLHDFSSQGQETHFYTTLFVTLSKEAVSGWPSPEGHPGLRPLNIISLQTSTWCQGQRLPLLKGNLSASFLLLPSRWQSTAHWKCSSAPKGKTFLLWMLLPPSLPP